MGESFDSGVALPVVAAPEPEFIPLSVAAEDVAVVCWPTEFVGYALYFNTHLHQTNWLLIPGVTNRYLEPPPPAPEKFFRLRHAARATSESPR